MDPKNIQLKTFGLGLGVLIPYLVMIHATKPLIGFWLFVTGFVCLLVLLNNIQAGVFKPVYFMALTFIYGLTLIQGHVGLISAAWLVAAIFILLITWSNSARLEPVYNIWMRGAHKIGLVFSVLIMSLFFYCVFAPLGLFFRLIKKDFLNRKIDPQAASYWNQREQKEFDQAGYTKQF